MSMNERTPQRRHYLPGDSNGRARVSGVRRGPGPLEELALYEQALTKINNRMINARGQMRDARQFKAEGRESCLRAARSELQAMQTELDEVLDKTKARTRDVLKMPGVPGMTDAQERQIRESAAPHISDTAPDLHELDDEQRGLVDAELDHLDEDDDASAQAVSA